LIDWNFLKVTLQPLMKARPENMKLYYGTNTSMVLEDGTRLVDCGVNSSNAKAQQPAELALVMREEGGSFDDIDLIPYSTPPPLPDVMKEHQN
jgi:elongin-B